MFIWTVIFIIVNFISVIMLLYYSARINKHFMFAQLICNVTIIALMYSMYFNINNWIEIKDWSALMDVIPTTNKILFCYLIVVIIVTIISTIFYYKNTNRI